MRPPTSLRKLAPAVGDGVLAVFMIGFTVEAGFAIDLPGFRPFDTVGVLLSVLVGVFVLLLAGWAAYHALGETDKATAAWHQMVDLLHAKGRIEEAGRIQRHLVEPGRA